MATAAIIAATALSVVGTLQAGADAQNAAERNAALARREAKLQEQRAGLNREQAARNAEAERRDARRRRGEARASAAGSGLTQGGSVIDILADQALEDELQIQNILFEGEVGARGAEDAATASEAEARASIARGKAARRQSFLRAGSQALGGASKAGVFNSSGGSSVPSDWQGAYNPNNSGYL